MGKNPRVIKTIIVHTQQKKHAVFKDKISAALKAATPRFWGGKETSRSEEKSINDLLSCSLAEKEKITNSFYIFSYELMVVGEVKIWKISPKF